MAEHDYDVLVIGSGPAGESAALNASKHRLKAAVIEQRPLLGGSCTHRGTIPSKALRHVVKQLMRFNSNTLYREIGNSRQISYPRMLSSAADVIKKQVIMRSKFYTRNDIHVFSGQARFVDTHTLDITLAEGGHETVTARNIVIATGSSPYRPEDVDFGHPRVYDSDTILDLKHTPRKVLIYGAGVIGSEYASIFSGLGIKVELINNFDNLLAFLDDEISDALSYHLRDTGVMVRHREEYERVETRDDSITLHLKSGKKLRADALLWCNGRRGNTGDLELERVGLEADSRGQLSVNKQYQTEQDNIYAVGDVIGWPSLASAAYDQGRSAAAVSRGKEAVRFVYDVPTGIYTIPEISSVGKTEMELTDAKVHFEVGRAFFKDTARGQISGERVGVLKILFHAETLEILGIHCFGAEATEIVHIGQAVMKLNGSLRYFIQTTFNYPTMAEAYRIAALNGLNRVHGF